MLRVTDPLGGVGEVMKTLVLTQVDLASLHVEEAKVEWCEEGGGGSEVRLEGEIGLPFGVDFVELTPVAEVGLNLGGVIPAVLPPTAVSLSVHGHDCLR